MALTFLSPSACSCQCASQYEALYQLREDSLFCDVSIVDESGTILQAHACVLSAGSPVLKSTLTLKQSTTMLKRKGITLKITGISSQVWNVILQFLYLNKISINFDPLLLRDIHIAAKMLGIDELVKLISGSVDSFDTGIELDNKVSAVNVTLAPTASSSYHNKSVQTNLDHEKCETVTWKLKNDSDDVDERLCSKRLKLGDDPFDSMSAVTMAEANENLESTADYSVTEISEANLANVDEDILEESMDCDLNKSSNHGNKTDKLVKVSKHSRKLCVSCRYCSMKFEKKSVLIDHIVENCEVFERKTPFTRTPEREQASTQHGTKNRNLQGSIDSDLSIALEEHGISERHLSLLRSVPHVNKSEKAQNKPFILRKNIKNISKNASEKTSYICLNENCQKSFTTHGLFFAHLTECVLKGGFQFPKEFVSESDGTMLYDDGEPVDLLSGAIATPSAKEVPKSSSSASTAAMYECNHCSLMLSQEKMPAHLAVVHAKRKPYECSLCPAAYGYYESFADHYISQHTNQTFTCNVCSLSFSKKDTLRRHNLLVHKRNGKSRYACKGCGKEFKYSHHARRHEKYHLNKNERQYVCSQCTKAFATKQDLVRHKDVHTGVKSFYCSKCTYSTARKSNLILHERRHGIVYGEFVCITCEKYFISETRFQSHLQNLNHKGCLVRDRISNQESEVTSSVPVDSQIAIESQEQSLNEPNASHLESIDSIHMSQVAEIVYLDLQDSGLTVASKPEYLTTNTGEIQMLVDPAELENLNQQGSDTSAQVTVANVVQTKYIVADDFVFQSQ